MSDQTIWEMVVEKSCQVSAGVEAQLAKEQERLQTCVLVVNPQVDIYDPEVKEILLFDDAILVKEQAERHWFSSILMNNRLFFLR